MANIQLSPTLILSDDCTGFWLYDETRGMNLSMRAKTDRDAFVEALTYYQERLLEIEKNYFDLQNKVVSFVSQFTHDEEF